MKRSKVIKKVLVKLSKKNKKDRIPGGLSDGVSDTRFDPEQLEKGIEIELEHTNDKDLAKEISKDHLTESPNYYITDKGEDRLKILEEEADKELS